MSTANTDDTEKNVQIWDLWIRLFHWCFATCIVFLLVSGTTGWQFFEWHRTIGEIVIALLLFRFCWGIVGSSNARLATFVSNPRFALQHLAELMKGKVAIERGHNAAGAWAVLAMLALITFQAVSGLFIADEEELIEGVFYGLLSSEQTNRLLHMHHLNATLIKLVVLLHVVMIAIYAMRASRNLVKPMLTGLISWPVAIELPPVVFQHRWVGLVIAVACAVLVGTTLSWW